MADPTLIERLTAAKEGSRELDAAVAVAIKHELPSPMGECGAYLKLPTVADGCAPGTYWLVQRSGMSLRTAPHYTTSIDDAVRWVVPEGLSSVDVEWSTKPGAGKACAVMQGDWDDDDGWTAAGHAATPALALCIAGLKARGGGRWVN